MTAKTQPPMFPAYVPAGRCWQATITLPAWAGFQARQGSHASPPSDAPSDGTFLLDIANSSKQPQDAPSQPQLNACKYLLENQSAITASALDALFRQYPLWQDDTNPHGDDDAMP